MLGKTLRWCVQAEFDNTDYNLPTCIQWNKNLFMSCRSIMSDIKRDNRVVSLSSRAGIRNSLVTILDQLQRCQKSLNEFLEVRVYASPLKIVHQVLASRWILISIFVCVSQEKRSAFPRFYFIGDDDLLEILGQATNPTVIQSHLKKLFAGHFHSHFLALVYAFVVSHLFFFVLFPRCYVYQSIFCRTWKGNLCFHLCRYPQRCVWWSVPAHCCHVFPGGGDSAAQKPCAHLQPRGGRHLFIQVQVHLLEDGVKGASHHTVFAFTSICVWALVCLSRCGWVSSLWKWRRLWSSFCMSACQRGGRVEWILLVTRRRY